jgi:lysophospholipase L1-like esterase
LLGLVPTRSEMPAYRARVEAFALENARLAEPCALLLGDSLSENFPSDRAAALGLATRGISGDRVRDLTRRLRPSVLEAPCRTILLLGGTNDIVGDRRTPAAVNAELLHLAERIAADRREVILVSLPPAGGEHAWASPSIEELNRLLAAEARRRDFRWLDLHAALAGSEGDLLTPDGLHLNALGYERFARLLEGAALPRNSSPRG